MPGPHLKICGPLAAAHPQTLLSANSCSNPCASNPWNCGSLSSSLALRAVRPCSLCNGRRGGRQGPSAGLYTGCPTCQTLFSCCAGNQGDGEGGCLPAELSSSSELCAKAGSSGTERPRLKSRQHICCGRMMAWWLIGLHQVCSPPPPPHPQSLRRLPNMCSKAKSRASDGPARLHTLSRSIKQSMCWKQPQAPLRCLHMLLNIPYVKPPSPAGKLQRRESFVHLSFILT